jgi:transposase-like protein
MRNLRQRHDPVFKAKVALEAVKGEKSMAQLSSEFGVHPNLIRLWRKHLLEELPSIFSKKDKRADGHGAEREAELYRQIGQLSVELEYLKKKSQVLG